MTPEEAERYVLYAIGKASNFLKTWFFFVRHVVRNPERLKEFQKPSFVFPGVNDLRFMEYFGGTSDKPIIFPRGFERTKKGKSLLRYYLNMSHEISTAATLPFEIRATEHNGLGVFSKSGDITFLQKKLVGWLHDMKRVRLDYHSAVAHEGEGVFLLFGPLQFANHKCDSTISFNYLNSKGNKKLVRGKQFITFPEETQIEAGEEVLMNYGDTFFLPGQCGCAICTE